ncbi:MAG: hypothetical protein H6900_11540 [Rhodobacter sp.]|uniref:hypothetical protein n=1 Tax=Pararhodobacter sp. TaxID=2127056 RepID=UPI001DC1FC43|nr:hypothetical protein [Pararhodobacter sp.]MCB1345881.1 hypothetical protein [Paracoccaceae bacterium]MCC0073909.1 hypothetical protein [Rhodobacter sp.]HPD92820.1 hypothetical protein [Pararhodobacter sp.]
MLKTLTRWFLRGAFVVALALTLFFGARFVMGVFYWNDPTHRDQQIEGWMPLGYVARSWDVPREVLREAAGLGPEDTARRNLDLIAQDHHIPLPQLIEALDSAIATWRADPSHD